MMQPYSPFLRRTLAGFAVMALAACSVSPTPYQVEADNGGYSEQRIEDDRYSVKFVGNRATPRDVVEEYALYRAAEVTIKHGYDYFKVVSREIEPVARGGSGVSPRLGIGLGGGNVGFGVSTGLGGGGGGSYAYAAYLDIVVYEGEAPEGDRDAYTALDVIDNLKAKVAANTPKSET